MPASNGIVAIDSFQQIFFVYPFFSFDKDNNAPQIPAQLPPIQS